MGVSELKNIESLAGGDHARFNFVAVNIISIVFLSDI